MRILHISDLHVTYPNESLAQVWISVSAALEGHQFDYVVVSGDLTQRATATEYEELRRFAETSLSPLLSDRPGMSEAHKRWRIVFVPGNHDVDWTSDIFTPIRVSSLPTGNYDDLKRQIADFKGRPETGDTRIFVGELGHVEFMRIDSTRDGIVEASVTLDGVQAPFTSPLAIVSPPFCNVVHERANTSRGEAVVSRTRLPDGRVRFLATESDFETLRWKYFLSNAVALTRAELDMLPSRQPWYTNIHNDEDARSHQVRFDCDHLLLSLSFEDGCPVLANGRVLAEQRGDDGSENYWREDQAETERCRRGFRIDLAERRLSVEINAPIVGHRYSLVFEPAREGDTYPEPAKGLARALLESFRNNSSQNWPFRERFSDSMSAALQQALGSPTPIVRWLGQIWHPDRRKLFAAFGHFPAKSWGVRFSAGSGIAGHSFRHSYPVAWTPRADDSTRTIFQEAPEHHDVDTLERGTMSNYEWVLELPLLLAKEGPSIGVVGLACERSTPKSTGVLKRSLKLSAPTRKGLQWKVRS